MIACTSTPHEIAPYTVASEQQYTVLWNTAPTAPYFATIPEMLDDFVAVLLLSRRSPSSLLLRLLVTDDASRRDGTPHRQLRDRLSRSSMFYFFIYDWRQS